MNKIENKILKKIIVYENSTIENAIKKLSNTGLQIVIVCNKQDKILGTITDGDIRRGLLKKYNLKSNINKIYNKKPFYLKDSLSESIINFILKNKSLSHVPIVDKKLKLKSVYSSKPIIEKDESKEKKNHILIMAGGYGKRLRPLTKNTPKPMLKIANKPILEHIINRLKTQGFINIFISTHFNSNKIIKYFGNGKKFGVKIKYLVEKKALGTAGALSNLKGKVKKPLLMMNGDILTEIDFIEFFKYHNLKKTDATIAVQSYNTTNPYGVFKIKGSRVTDFFEKPIQTNFINSGIYILDPKLLRLIPKKTKFDMSNLLKMLILKNIKLSAFPIHELWSDIGDLNNFNSALNRLK
jgi:dTDP-glucose pyrophosphorylase